MKLRKIFTDIFDQECNNHKFSIVFKKKLQKEYFLKIKYTIRLFDKYARFVNNSRNFILFDFKNLHRDEIKFEFKYKEGKEYIDDLEIGDFV